mmetsp:Transcript_36142/g.56598  ORF Transcript_36142/g.56598 Transcript_36142/m.56598 type:complete len:85 (+) Transcript_36142:191-445(+)
MPGGTAAMGEEGREDLPEEEEEEEGEARRKDEELASETETFLEFITIMDRGRLFFLPDDLPDPPSLPSVPPPACPPDSPFSNSS